MTDADTTVPVRLVAYGETTVAVDRDRFDAAVAAGRLDHELDWHLSNLDTDHLVVVGDTAYDPLEVREGRHVGHPTLLGRGVTAALVALVREALRPRFVTATLDEQAHAVAEHLVAQARRENLIVMPLVDADAVIRAASKEREGVDNR